MLKVSLQPRLLLKVIPTMDLDYNVKTVCKVGYDDGAILVWRAKEHSLIISIACPRSV